MPRPENFDEILAGGWRHITPDGLRTVIDYVQELENEKLARGLLEPRRVTLVREIRELAPDGASVKRIETTEVEVAFLDAEVALPEQRTKIYGSWMLPMEPMVRIGPR